MIQHAIIGEFSLYVRLGLVVDALRAEGYAIEIAQVDANQTSERIAQELCQEAVDGLRIGKNPPPNRESPGSRVEFWKLDTHYFRLGNWSGQAIHCFAFIP